MVKRRYIGFYGTDLEERLKGLSPGKSIGCGICTDTCVLHPTADARSRDCQVTSR